MLDINELEIYDSLNLTKKLEIPKRSRLFPIKPIGVGTPFAESLISYVIRLAQEHCLTAETLIMGEIEPQIMGQQYDSALIHKDLKIIFRNKNNRTPAINGMSNLTQLLVSTLENLTLRQDLKFLSCVTWKGIIKEERLFRQYKAWCPYCLEQWRKENQSIYEPLIWSFKEVFHCSKHYSILVDQCPYCEYQSPMISAPLKLGFCPECKSWLGGSQDEEDMLSQISSFGDFFYILLAGINDFIEVTPRLVVPPKVSYLRSKLQLIHSYYKKRGFSPNLYRSRLMGLDEAMEQLEITLKGNENEPLSLTRLLIPICYHAKISLSQLLSEDLLALRETLLDNL